MVEASSLAEEVVRSAAASDWSVAEEASEPSHSKEKSWVDVDALEASPATEEAVEAAVESTSWVCDA